MSSTATIKAFPYPAGRDLTQRNIIVRGTISLTSGTYPVGGFPLSWTTVGSSEGPNASGGAGYVLIQSQYTNTQIDSARGNVVSLPTEVDTWSVANPPSGYSYVVDRSVGNLHIMVASNGASGASGPMVEFGGTVVTAMINDVIQFTAVFPLADV